MKQWSCARDIWNGDRYAYKLCIISKSTINKMVTVRIFDVMYDTFKVTFKEELQIMN
jgi:hypothetical protein